MLRDAPNAHVALMFNKAWRWLTAQLGGKPPDQLRLRVHRDPKYPSSWLPVYTLGQQPRLEIQIYLEADNEAAAPCWIAAAEIAGAPMVKTVIGVRDAKTGTFAADNPLPPRHLSTVSLHFLVDGPPPLVGEPFDALVILTDHAGARHSVKVTMHE